MLPDAIHHDPGGQRIVGPNQPAGESQASTGLGSARPRRTDLEGRFPVRERRWYFWFHAATIVVRFATPQNASRRRNASVPQGLDFRFRQLLVFNQFDLALGAFCFLSIDEVRILELLGLNLQICFKPLRQILLYLVSILWRRAQHGSQILTQGWRELLQLLTQQFLLNRLGLLIKFAFQ